MPNAADATPIQFAAAGGVTLRGDAWGLAGAPDALLLHGGGQTRHSWAATGRRLGAEGWRAAALDLRGHGESDWSPDGVYGVEVFLADLRAVLAGLDEPPVLVGASLGGWLSLLAEGESEIRVCRALVLVDVTPRLEPRGVSRIIDFMTARPEGFASLEEAADAVAAYRRHRARPDDLSGLRKNLRRGEDGRWRWHWDPAFLRPSSTPSRYEQTDRLLEAARRLTVPTLLVRGRESDVVSEEGAAEFLRAVPQARFADVSRAGHMVAGDRNDAFSAAVVGFLRDVRDGLAAG
jgi:pimeloyl-ACP methyl ester carboxylesterase